MISIYYAHRSLVEEEDIFDSLYGTLHTARQQKINKRKNPIDKQCSLLGGVLLRRGLEDKGLIYEDLDFYSVTGEKPYVKGQKDICFCLSHSGDYAVCGIANGEIGIDIERTNRRLFEVGKEESFLRVIKKSFSLREQEALLQTATREVQQELFLKYWTRKESISKVLGTGLATDFTFLQAPERNFCSRWLKNEYYISVYSAKAPIAEEDLRFYEFTEKDIKECMMN